MLRFVCFFGQQFAVVVLLVLNLVFLLFALGFKIYRGSPCAPRSGVSQDHEEENDGILTCGGS